MNPYDLNDVWWHSPCPPPKDPRDVNPYDLGDIAEDNRRRYYWGTCAIQRKTGGLAQFPDAQFGINKGISND